MVGVGVEDITIPSVSVLRSLGDYIHQVRACGHILCFAFLFTRYNLLAGSVQAADQATLTATIGEYKCNTAAVKEQLSCPPVHEPHEFRASESPAHSIVFTGEFLLLVLRMYVPLVACCDSTKRFLPGLTCVFFLTCFQKLTTDTR